MEQTALYSMISDAGCVVLMFEDHPQFFGNWRAMVRRHQKTLEVVSDRRDGWLSLWLYESGKGEKLFEVESTRLDQSQELAQIADWLADIPK
ncbi:hypothetical protein [Roseateles sp. PN1]|uniref:hypothetical protein n=1 Tax=Roseateles sp. PN1 TaxID=3137372 RepID=UPI00313862FF